jgi:hypothetical protein
MTYSKELNIPLIIIRVKIKKLYHDATNECTMRVIRVHFITQARWQYRFCAVIDICLYFVIVPQGVDSISPFVVSVHTLWNRCHVVGF